MDGQGLLQIQVCESIYLTQNKILLYVAFLYIFVNFIVGQSTRIVFEISISKTASQWPDEASDHAIQAKILIKYHIHRKQFVKTSESINYEKMESEHF